ncbi:hypothetical protein Bca4012_065525 [Brassica carinata]
MNPLCFARSLWLPGRKKTSLLSSSCSSCHCGFSFMASSLHLRRYALPPSSSAAAPLLSPLSSLTPVLLRPEALPRILKSLRLR